MAEKKIYSERVAVKGILMFPKKDGSKLTACIGLEDPEMIYINRAVKKFNETKGTDYALKATDVKDGEKSLHGINVKTSKNIGVFDTEDKKMDLTLDTIPHGSKVTAILSIVEYDYRGKKGLTAYVNTVIVDEIKEYHHRDLIAELRG